MKSGMMHATVASAIGYLILCQQVLAQDEAAKLYGSWKLISWVAQIAGENSPSVHPLGLNPKGRLILMPNGYMMAILSASDRKPAQNDAQRAALLQSMVAYTGTYTIEGDKLTTIVDQSHNVTLMLQPQVRYFKVDGDKLYLRVPEQP